jgi:hypothetical protein
MWSGRVVGGESGSLRDGIWDKAHAGVSSMYSMESMGCEFFPSPVVCVGVSVLGGSSRVVDEEESLLSDVCMVDMLLV